MTTTTADCSSVETHDNCRHFLAAGARFHGPCAALLLSLSGLASIDPSLAGEPAGTTEKQPNAARMLVDYYEQMCTPKPFVVRKGLDIDAHRRQLKQQVLQSVGLRPLPDRISLDARQSEPLDHPWCTIRRISYQLWPGVYSSGFLLIPKDLQEQPAPAVLCPHGHWKDGNAHPEVQKRCLNLARLGYITFSSVQHHYEDLYIGVSHQTLMIWNNMRALDYLETLPQVDKDRIGVAGASGGGLQAQMITALDPRVKVASIVGLTCDFRRIMFPDRHHCVCNHFPGVMRFTDHPEISALGFPAAVQFLTMNDWTQDFEQENLPTILAQYAASGRPDRVHCKYFNTPHTYDKEKRQYTYWWMERWLRGKESADPNPEPQETETFPVETLTNLTIDVPEDRGFSHIGEIYRQEWGFQAPVLSTPAQWCAYRQRMVDSLAELLGERATLPREGSDPEVVSSEIEGELVVERVSFPSEGGIQVPTIVVRRKSSSGKLPIVLVVSKGGRQTLFEEEGERSATSLAREGALVVLPDVRCFGELNSTGGKNAGLQDRAWERNGIVWGRPVPGMACTDLRAVLDGLSSRPDADTTRVRLISRDSGDLAIAAIFAAVFDSRITSLDVDLNNGCFEKRNLALVSNVLRHGDVLQWSALMADRSLIVRNVPREAGDTEWLAGAFAIHGNGAQLRVE